MGPNGQRRSPTIVFSNTGQALPSHQSLYEKSFEATSRSIRSEEFADTGDPRNTQVARQLPGSQSIVLSNGHSQRVQSSRYRQSTDADLEGQSPMFRTLNITNGDLWRV